MKNDVSKREQKDIFPERPLNYRRCLVIGFCAIYVLSMSAWWFLLSPEGTSPLERFLGHQVSDLAPYLIFLVLTACYATLLTSVYNIAVGNDKNFDERQHIIRDRSYRYAYRVVGALFLLFVFYVSQHSSGANFPLPSDQIQSSLIVTCAMLVVVTLPTSIIAWTEREV